VHLVSDEMYSTCVFGGSFVSVLDFCAEGQRYVHAVSGLAKLGWSGAKVGYVYTESAELVGALRALARIAPLAKHGAIAATRLLSSEAPVVDAVLAANARLLGDHYHAVARLLERKRIPYLPAGGGLTVVLDLRAACGSLELGWPGEEAMHAHLLASARVNLASGREFGFRDPGYFRMTFAEKLSDVTGAVEGIAALLKRLGVARVTARESILQRYRALWQRTDQIFGLLKDSAFLEQPIALRHPFLFYVGHLPAFAWNQLASMVSDVESPDAELCALFERGIDPDVDSGAVHVNSAGVGRSDWPSLERVRVFRDRVRNLLPGLIGDVLALEDGSQRLELQDSRIFEMVFEHEAMHQETLLYMLNCLKPELFNVAATEKLLFAGEGRKSAPYGAPKAPDTSFAVVPGNKGMVMGASLSSGWGWDNEFPCTEVAVEDFAIRRTPVTNEEFLPFVKAGGYTRRDLWDAEDWAWLLRDGIVHPVHWQPSFEEDGRSGWSIRLLGGRCVPLADEALHWPVQVSHAEARAWCRWREDGSRLPTEAEWYHAAYSEVSESGVKYRDYPWGSQPPTPAHGNFGFARYRPTHVMQHPASRSHWGLYDLIGNGWEWTSSEFRGFPGFEPVLSTYPGYSSDFFDGKHFTLRGGSFATVSESLRRSFRNWYQGRYPYVFSKFRPVRPLGVDVATNGRIVRLEEATSAQVALSEFAAHVKNGLGLKMPQVSSLYFYDDAGSEIYAEITRVPEYYLTRTEHAILRSCVPAVAEVCAKMGRAISLLEFGAGDGHKTQTIIDDFVARGFDLTYFPIDISEAALVSLLETVRAPRVTPVVANNLTGAAYVVSQVAAPTLALFLGSSIGNYDLPDAKNFLRGVNALLRKGDMLLIGFDLKKDLSKLRAAYSDSQGVTARFNMNLLTRINRELGGNFDTESGVWQHWAVYNPTIGAMESWLMPTKDQTVTLGPIAGNSTFHFRAWGGIRTERSHKYNLDLIQEMAAAAEFTVVKHFVEEGYCVSLWSK
jgi:iron(II)-dependent oxidoreductase